MFKLNEEQQKEISTIKERTITLKLSDADCERLARKCGECGLTVGQLFENFVGDLVDGTYSNGSDERMHAEEWFNRCWFAHPYEETLLKELLDWNRDIEDFITACDEKDHFKEHPEEYKDELEDQSIEDLWFNEDYRYYTEEFLENHPGADMEKEINLCRKYLEDLAKLKGED